MIDQYRIPDRPLLFWAKGWARLYEKSLPMDLQPGSPSQKRDQKIIDRHYLAVFAYFQFFIDNP